MSFESLINLNHLEAALNEMQPHQPIFKIIKKEMLRRGHWKNAPRGWIYNNNIYLEHAGICSIPTCEEPALYGMQCEKHTVDPSNYGVKKLREIPHYNTWRAMLVRCYYSHLKTYKNYGGRGIKVCQGWRDSYPKFHSDMGPKPYTNKTYSLDRINNNGNYSCGKCEECIANSWPMNCRWADNKTQRMNQRRML